MKGFALSCVKHGECNVYNFKIRIADTQNYQTNKTFAGSLLNFKTVSPRKFMTELAKRIAKMHLNNFLMQNMSSFKHSNA